MISDLEIRAPSAAPSLRFGVLGPVRVWRHGRKVELGSRQRRLVLGLLLARAGQPVGIADFVALLWGQEPPASAVNIVHGHVGNLRRLFEPGLRPRVAGRWLAGDAAGYRMSTDEENLDLLEMRRSAQQARAARDAGDVAGALAAYVKALQLSRGPCAGAPELLGHRVADFESIDHEYADLISEATDLALSNNAAKSVLPMLRRVVEHRSLDEAVQARLLLALSAAGQQAEAITHFQDLRRRLADDLGVDPGDELHEAYRKVLTRSHAEPAKSSEISAHEEAQPKGDHFVRPAQLLPDLPHFAGRRETLRQALDLVRAHATSGAPQTLVMEGIPGVGKTSLAIHLAYRLAHEFPDGQLYVDLRGFGPDAALAPGEVLHAFLHALGVRDQDIPDSDLARSGLYRSMLANRRVLIVLDNTRDADQVRPLLPGAPGSLVLVTSRNSLAGLAATHGAHILTLDLLPKAEAREMLISRIGSAANFADRQVLDEIVELCGRLPLALAIAAARGLAYPGHGLSAIARELREAQGSLDGFAFGDPNIDLRAVFSCSYRSLNPSAARIFRLMALHPASDIAIPALASLGGLTQRDTRDVVRELVLTRLVSEHQPGRYSTHDLIAAFARELVLDTETDADRDAAVDRLLVYYRKAAYEANLYINAEIDAEPPAERDGVAREDLTSRRDAAGWFTAELPALKAIMRQAIGRGRVTDAWQLELTVQGFYQLDGWWREWATVVRECLEAADDAGDSSGVANMLRSLAGAEFYLGNIASARVLLERAFAIFTELGNVSRQALTLRNLGEVSFAAGDYGRSVVYFREALKTSESLGELASQADVLCRLADAQYQLGSYAEGIEAITRALNIAGDLADDFRRCECLLRRAEWHLREGRYHASQDDWTAAAELARAGDHRVYLVNSYIGFGDTAYAKGNRQAAQTAWLQALALVNDSPDRYREADVQGRLAKLNLSAKDIAVQKLKSNTAA